MRLFLSYIVKEKKTFDPLAILELGIRIFLIALYSIKDEMDANDVIKKVSEVPLSDNIPVDYYPDPDTFDKQLLPFYESAIAFRSEK